VADGRTIAVLGATGRVGGQVLAQLAGTGAAVRAVGRDPTTVRAAADRYGAEPAVADLTEPASLAPVVDGVDAAFLVFPSVAADHLAAEIVAALTAGARRVVYLSAHGVPDDGRPAGAILDSHALVERLLTGSAREWTFLRAGGFAANTLAWAEQTRGGGTEVRWFGAGVTRALVHEADLAGAAVRALLDDDLVGARPHLSGPEQLTQAAQLAAVGTAIGRSLRFVELDRDAAVAQLFGGLPPEFAAQIVDAQLAMVDTPEPRTDEVARILGRPARTYAQWAGDHADDFR
jgi:uncharacterized protein YbjT (DUF2867 family)